MIPPVHQWKVYMRFPYEEKPSWSYEGRCCWLGSGVLDKNGVEIFEGDIVKNPDGELSTVKFERGCMCVDNDVFEDIGSHVDGYFEIVGHIAEEAHASAKFD